MDLRSESGALTDKCMPKTPPEALGYKVLEILPTDLTMRAEETVHAENDDGRNLSQQTSILKYLRRG
jgi:hypothetical protein